MFIEATFRQILLPSSGCEKYLSKRCLIKHTCSQRKNLQFKTIENYLDIQISQQGVRLFVGTAPLKMQ